jgi:hypothetical protein
MRVGVAGAGHSAPCAVDPACGASKTAAVAAATQRGMEHRAAGSMSLIGTGRRVAV